MGYFNRSTVDNFASTVLRGNCCYEWLKLHHCWRRYSHNYCTDLMCMTCTSTVLRPVEVFQFFTMHVHLCPPPIRDWCSNCISWFWWTRIFLLRCHLWHVDWIWCSVVLDVEGWFLLHLLQGHVVHSLALSEPKLKFTSSQHYMDHWIMGSSKFMYNCQQDKN